MMTKFIFKKSFLIVLICFIFQSCATDENTSILEIEDPISTPSSDLIVDWSSFLLTIDRHATGMRPNATARSLAYIHLAVYETAVPLMDGYASQTQRLEGLSIDTNRLESDVNINIALNECYERVLDHFLYNISTELDTSISQFSDTKLLELNVGTSPTAVSNSLLWGQYVAEQVIAYSLTDTEAEMQQLEPQPISYEPPVGKGYWTYSAEEERALFPYWASVRTFVISAEQTSTLEPLSYNIDPSSTYFKQMNEVYEVANTARIEGSEDLWIAEFWSDDVEGLMMSPPGRQLSIAKQLIEQTNLDGDRALAMLLKLGFALNDAAVSTWADKYEYMVMRPNVYINDFIDPEFQTNLYRLIFWPNPSFPGYPSGHSCFAAAAGGVFINELGDAINFTDRTHDGRVEFRGTARSYTSISDMITENAYSRIPLGVHLRMDCDEGMRLGLEISDAVNQLELIP